MARYDPKAEIMGDLKELLEDEDRGKLVLPVRRQKDYGNVRLKGKKRNWLKEGRQREIDDSYMQRTWKK